MSLPAYTSIPVEYEIEKSGGKLGWTSRKLLDGNLIPELADGSWHSGNNAQLEITQALRAGIHHIDTAQIYKNEILGDYFLTSKWSGMALKGIPESMKESLSYLGVESLDLYLVHSPRLVTIEGGAIETWKKMIQVKKEGKTKSIGVSNYKIADLEIIRKAGLELPVVNQILLHPYVYEETLELLRYHQKHGIVTEAYSVLTSITNKPGGPVDLPVSIIAEREGVTPGEVLLAWARSKGAVVITASSSPARLETYIRAGRLSLSRDDIVSIDEAGAKGSSSLKSKARKVARIGLHVAAGVNAVYWLTRWYSGSV